MEFINPKNIEVRKKNESTLVVCPRNSTGLYELSVWSPPMLTAWAKTTMEGNLGESPSYLDGGKITRHQAKFSIQAKTGTIDDETPDLVAHQREFLRQAYAGAVEVADQIFDMRPKIALEKIKSAESLARRICNPTGDAASKIDETSEKFKNTAKECFRSDLITIRVPDIDKYDQDGTLIDPENGKTLHASFNARQTVWFKHSNLWGGKQADSMKTVDTLPSTMENWGAILEEATRQHDYTPFLYYSGMRSDIPIPPRTIPKPGYKGEVNDKTPKVLDPSWSPLNRETDTLAAFNVKYTISTKNAISISIEGQRKIGIFKQKARSGAAPAPDMSIYGKRPAPEADAQDAKRPKTGEAGKQEAGGEKEAEKQEAGGEKEADEPMKEAGEKEADEPVKESGEKEADEPVKEAGEKDDSKQGSE